MKRVIGASRSRAPAAGAFRSAFRSASLGAVAGALAVLLEGCPGDNEAIVFVAGILCVSLALAIPTSLLGRGNGA